MRFSFLPIATLAVTAALGAAGAQRTTPQDIIVNPTNPDLNVRVWTGRDTTGKGEPAYRIGEDINLYATTNQDAYVYLFNVNPDGTIDLILPNRFSSGDNFVKANTVKQFPPQGADFEFNVAGPTGVNRVLALASTRELDLSTLTRFREQQNFADVTVRGQQNLGKALSIVVRPLPDRAWVTDTAAYRVVRQLPGPPDTQPGAPGSGALPQPPQDISGPWRATFTAERDLSGVFDVYSRVLRDRGWTVRNTVQGRGSVLAFFERQGGGLATLSLERVAGNQYRVRIDTRR